MINQTSIKRAIDTIECRVRDPRRGLPEDLFLLASRITPLVNVDLLIKNEKNQTLLTWRNDGYGKAGWHIPGGIIRYKETIADRIHAVALNELGADVEFQNNPLSINEVIHPRRRNRGHFISFLFECRLMNSLNREMRYEEGVPRPGVWAWHDRCPRNIISVHEMYRNFI